MNEVPSNNSFKTNPLRDSGWSSGYLNASCLLVHGGSA
jgi:hypothetical protein